MILGNIEGIRKTTLNQLEEIYELSIPKDSICSLELIKLLSDLTEKLEREISIAIDRKGKVISVGVGDSSTVDLPLIDIKENRLSSVRIIHSHPSGNPKLSALDTSALVKLKLDSMVALGVNKNFEESTLNLGFCDVDNNILTYEEIGPLSINETLNFNFLERLKYIEDCIKDNEIEEDHIEKAILVGIDSEENLDELQELAEACNVQTVYKVFQKKSKTDKAFFIGSGKVDEIQMIRQALRANVVIFDDELSGIQVRNLEENIGVKVIDRTTLILEIFATRARTKEAKLQVELAQLKYRSARLIGLGTVLSRTGGGIGTKGPGEKKLEIDRRRIRERINDLHKELEKIKQTRQVQREKREQGNIPRISLVGYTNTGKSTLRNKLCEIAPLKNSVTKEKVFEANMLFATLDTTVRSIMLPDNRTATLSDTVGFVRKLPHELVESFKSTLEEVIGSDLLLHVVDASSDKLFEQIQAVNEVLEQIGAKPENAIILLNKIDKIDKLNEEKLNYIKEQLSNYKLIPISAKCNINLESMLKEISKSLPQTLFTKTFIIPYTEQGMVALIHRNSKVELEEYREEGTFIKALVDKEIYNKCKEYEI